MGNVGEEAMQVKGLSWDSLFRVAAAPWDQRIISINGWMMAFDGIGEGRGEEATGYFLIVPEPVCCGACAAGDPFGCLEAFADQPLARSSEPMRFTGRLVCLKDDALGYAYQLREVTAKPATGDEGPPSRFGLSRRRLLQAAGMAAALAACAPERSVTADTASGTPLSQRIDSLLVRTVTADIHSHAGAVIRESGALRPVAEPMRAGRMSVISLAIVADRGTTQVMPDHRIEAFREPDPGELFLRSRHSFGRLRALIEQENLAVVRSAADLRPAAAVRPAVIVASEGADFLESDPDRLDEAYRTYDLRHLQLTHYRVNPLGDIQTAAPVHGGLTDFGAEVIRRCNRLGIVVDVAHGTFPLVTRAAEISSRPLILSHTSLATKPGPRSRQITAEHARVIAATGGVIGIWPVSTIFPDLAAYARGIARMADVVGAAHVGLGSDMLGLTVPSVFGDYRQLPAVAEALLATGFNDEEAAGILGGNYARVFAQSVGA
jgi:membrane dipeptidase